jgi:hypothetical protein
MPQLENPENEMRKRILGGRAVIVAGTGVSIAATIDPIDAKPHPQASWIGLLRHGLERGREIGRIDHDTVDVYQKLLQLDPTTHNLISVASAVTNALGGIQSSIYSDWLAQTIGQIKAHDRGILDSLNALRKQGNLLATTNYDSLLLGDSLQLTPVTWNQKDLFLSAARGELSDAVIFLHGHWQSASSVVLDWKSYDAISRDEEYRDDLLAVWKMTTWVYVGCGLYGLGDPDLDLLLDRYGERARNASQMDYCFVRKKDQESFQKHFDDRRLNICAISFGEEHSDLPTYLCQLTSNSPSTSASTSKPLNESPSGIPPAPAFYAEPDYIGSHRFVGREAELLDISKWAGASEQSNLLIFDAIGGSGKSMLTWEWLTKFAPTVRTDWAGRFWYSFYEHGAVMEDFCRRALAYTTGKPLKEFTDRKTSDMKGELISLLHSRPWLFVLDGLERILVAYHRIHASELADANVDEIQDELLERNTCDAIREEDNDLLRALAACSPSKILVSSRLVPRALLNASRQPIPGVCRATLGGLSDVDAERLLRSCDISGDSTQIQLFLRRNCGNHPLVIGVIAGLIANYLPDRFNFDRWLIDSVGGAAIALGNLELKQRRSNILDAAFTALPTPSRQLLTLVSFFSESVEYHTLEDFARHFEEDTESRQLSSTPSQYASSRPQVQLVQTPRPATGRNNLTRVSTTGRSTDFVEMGKKRKLLEDTVGDLERRGLLQFDAHYRRFELHPVVRSLVSKRMHSRDRKRLGSRVLDYFSSLPKTPYEMSSSLDELQVGLNIYRAFIKIERFKEAARILRCELEGPLFFNVEAYSDVLPLIHPFFPNGWDQLPKYLTGCEAACMVGCAGNALLCNGAFTEAVKAHGVAIQALLEIDNWCGASVYLRNLIFDFLELSQLASVMKACQLSIEFSESASLYDDV